MDGVIIIKIQFLKFDHFNLILFQTPSYSVATVQIYDNVISAEIVQNKLIYLMLLNIYP